MRWREFFYGQPNQMPTNPIFKSEKTNFPKNHIAPQPLQICLNAIKSAIQDPANLNKVHPNLPEDERLAMKSLIELQKQMDKQLSVIGA